MIKFLAKETDFLKNFQLNKTKYIQILLAHCEKAKKILSNDKESIIDIENDGQDSQYVLKRDVFERINENLFHKCVSEIQKLLENNQLNKDQIGEVFMIGGSSRIPKLQSLIMEYFDNKPLNYSMNANETVAYGASIYSAFSAGHKIKNLNSFEVKEKCKVNYLLKIDMNYFNFFLQIDSSSILPFYQSIFLKNVNKLYIKLELLENNKKIFKNDEWVEEFGFTEIILEVNTNNMVSVMLFNINNETTRKINRLKLYCLDEKSIDSIIGLNFEQAKQLNQAEMNRKRKNSLEKRCFELRKAGKILGSEFKNFETKVNEILNRIKMVKSSEEYEHLNEMITRELVIKLTQFKEKKEQEEKQQYDKEQNIKKKRHENNDTKTPKLMDFVLMKFITLKLSN